MIVRPFRSWPEFRCAFPVQAQGAEENIRQFQALRDMLVTKKPQPGRVREIFDTGHRPRCYILTCHVLVGMPILSLKNTYRPLLETPRKVGHARRLKHLADLELVASCPLDVLQLCWADDGLE